MTTQDVDSEDEKSVRILHQYLITVLKLSWALGDFVRRLR